MAKYNKGDTIAITSIAVTEVDDEDHTYKLQILGCPLWVSQSTVDCNTTMNKASYPIRQQKWIKDNNVTHNTLVKVTRKAESCENGWNNTWIKKMDDYVGNTYPVSTSDPSICSNSGIHLYNPDTELSLAFPYFILEVISTPSYEDRQEVWLKNNNVQVGMMVKVANNNPNCPGWSDHWADAFAGQEAVINNIHSTMGIQLSNGTGVYWWYPYTALEVIGYALRPTEFVLCRDDPTDKWRLDIFCYKNNENTSNYKFTCIHNSWDICIPYKRNEHLLNKVR